MMKHEQDCGTVEPELHGENPKGRKKDTPGTPSGNRSGEEGISGKSRKGRGEEKDKLGNFLEEENEGLENCREGEATNCKGRDGKV